MIALVEGPPGNGKSFYAIRKAADALAAGKVVATNVDFADDACDRIAAQNPYRRLVASARRKRAAQLQRSLLVSDDLDELFSVRLRGSGESRGVMILDEAHNWMNARSWSAKDRAGIVKFFTQHRKLGWDVYLIAQDAEMIDAQVRRNAEFIVSLRNLKRAKMLGLPVIPVNLFVAIWRWHATGSHVAKREAFRLNYAKDLYSTFQTSHGLEDDEDAALWLPRTADSAKALDPPPVPSGAHGGMPTEPTNGTGPAPTGPALQPASPDDAGCKTTSP